LTAPAFLHRLHQIALALRIRTAPDIEPSFFPSESVWRMFSDLHPHDQRHLIAVFDRAREAGLPDTLCQAALLHDIGKVTFGGTRISLVARIIHVVLQRLSPATGCALAEINIPWLGIGLRLAHHHGKLGAERLRAIGMPCDICHAVEIHDDKGQRDPDIRALQNIDSATP
jgi:hypothetical protein